MDYILTFEDGSDAYLSHHGVKGMKWGVRNAETLRRYANDGGPKPTKRQVEKAIRENKKAYKKSTGGRALVSWTDLGSNVAEVDRQHSDAEKNDLDLQKARKRVQRASEKFNKANEQLLLAEDYRTRLNKPDSGATYTQKKRAKNAHVQAEANYWKANHEYYKARDLEDAHSTRIAKQFLSKYENAAAKDLGFKDVEAGKKLLNEYGLMKKAINANGYGLRYSHS